MPEPPTSPSPGLQSSEPAPSTTTNPTCKSCRDRIPIGQEIHTINAAGDRLGVCAACLHKITNKQEKTPIYRTGTALQPFKTMMQLATAADGTNPPVLREVEQSGEEESTDYRVDRTASGFGDGETSAKPEGGVIMDDEEEEEDPAKYGLSRQLSGGLGPGKEWKPRVPIVEVNEWPTKEEGEKKAETDYLRYGLNRRLSGGLGPGREWKAQEGEGWPIEKDGSKGK